MYESICFSGIMHIQFLHFEVIFMQHIFHDGESVMAHYVYVYVSINSKVNGNCNVTRCTYIDLFVILI